MTRKSISDEDLARGEKDLPSRVDLRGYRKGAARTASSGPRKNFVFLRTRERVKAPLLGQDSPVHVRPIGRNIEWVKSAGLFRSPGCFVASIVGCTGPAGQTGNPRPTRPARSVGPLPTTGLGGSTGEQRQRLRGRGPRGRPCVRRLSLRRLSMTQSTTILAAIQSAEGCSGDGGRRGPVLPERHMRHLIGHRRQRVGGAIAGSGHGLYGAVQMATVLRTSSTTDDVFRITTPDAITIRELQIDAPWVKKTSGAGDKIQPTAPPYGSNMIRQSRLENLTIYNMSDGVELYNSANFAIATSLIQDFLNNGVYDQSELGHRRCRRRHHFWEHHLGLQRVLRSRGHPAGSRRWNRGRRKQAPRRQLWSVAYREPGPYGSRQPFHQQHRTAERLLPLYCSESTASKTYGNILFTANECSILGIPSAQSGVTFASGLGGPYLSNAVLANNVFNMALTQGAILTIEDGAGVNINSDVLNNLGTGGASGIRRRVGNASR